MGGSSKSSSSTDSTTTTSTATSTGTVGDVIQGQQITVNQAISDQELDVYKQLVALTGKALDVAAIAGKQVIDATTDFAKSTATPDIKVTEGNQAQTKFIIGAAAVALVAVNIFRK